MSNVWTMQYLTRPSAAELRKRFQAQLNNETSRHPGTPYHVQVAYYVGAAAWRGPTGQAWHLAAPSASSVLSMCVHVLIQQHVLQPGQIVLTSATKLIGKIDENVLIVSIESLDAEAKLDKPNLDLKLLKWFIEKSAIAGREPTREAFKKLFKNLKKKNKK